MAEFIRSIAGRLREFVGNRRRAPRYRTRLGAEIALRAPVAKAGARQSGQSLKLTGHTRDISTSGLALIVPAIHIGGNYITGEDRRLRIKLKLPSGPVEIEAKPVRYTPLEEDAADTGYLVGVQIERMSENDRARYEEYIQKQESGVGSQGSEEIK